MPSAVNKQLYETVYLIDSSQLTYWKVMHKNVCIAIWVVRELEETLAAASRK